MGWFLKLSDEKSRRQGLVNQFPKVDPAIIDNVIAADPSVNKQYGRFILQWVLNGTVRLPEDNGRLAKALGFFGSNLAKFQKKDISLYPTFNDLEETIDNMQGIDLRSRRQMTQDIKTQGTKEVYRDKLWRVIQMTTPQAVCELGKGTKWCTSSDKDGLENAEDYLQSGPLYLFLRNENGVWNKFAQATSDFSQLMDVRDRRIEDLSEGMIVAIKTLAKSGFISNEDFWTNISQESEYPGVDSDLADWLEHESSDWDGKFPERVYEWVLNHIRNFGNRLPAVEDRFVFKKLLSDKKYNGLMDGARMEEYLDAINLKGRISEREPQIIQSSYALEYWKYRYCQTKNKKIPGKDYNPWPEYEQAMLANKHRDEEMVEYLWLLNANNRADPVYEKYLLSCAEGDSPEHCIDYAANCGRWTELERLILASKDPVYINDYATRVIEGRWEAAEPLILNNTWTAYSYARDVLRGRWPEAEQSIINAGDGWTAAVYAVNVMKSRWPEMEKSMKNFGFDDTNMLYQKTFGVNLKEASVSWYKEAQEQGSSNFVINGPFDGAGHMTTDEPATIFEAKIGNESIGYILVIMPPNRNPYIGQVTIAPEHRLKGVATALYSRVDSYLRENKKLPLKPSRDLSPGSRRIWDKRLRDGIGKLSQRLSPQQVGMYQNFKSPTGVQLKGSGMSAVFNLPGINQSINGAQLMNQVIGRIKGILNQNNVHTIDTSPIARADAIGLAVSSEPGTVHVDIAKILNEIKNQSLPSVTQLDGTEIDKDVQNDIIGKISNYITNQLANTAAHESRHNQDYFNTFPTGKFESPEGGAEAFGNQIANQYFRL